MATTKVKPAAKMKKTAIVKLMYNKPQAYLDPKILKEYKLLSQKYRQLWKSLAKK